MASCSRPAGSRSKQILAKYGQVGDVHFSPNGAKLAYAAAVGDPEKESGAVYVIDIATGKQTRIAETKKSGYFHVNGWKDAIAVDYSEDSY